MTSNRTGSATTPLVQETTLHLILVSDDDRLGASSSHGVHCHLTVMRGHLRFELGPVVFAVDRSLPAAAKATKITAGSGTLGGCRVGGVVVRFERRVASLAVIPKLVELGYLQPDARRRATAVGQSGADNGGPPMASENADQIADRIRQHRQAARLLTGRPASRKNLKPCCLRGAFRGAPLLLQQNRAFLPPPPSESDNP
jgi:hypothetical protein